MADFVPDWQLPPGVNRGLWDYLHDADLACNYDASLANNTLLHVDQVFCEQHFDRPGRLIDLGCGTGRLLLPFARRGWWVLGVDLSAEMLKVARSKAAVSGLSVALLQANLVELACLQDQSFDHAVCLFSTLGMIQGIENRQRVLEHAFRLLRPGGRIVLHVHNRWFNLWDPQGRCGCCGILWPGAKRGDRVMPAHQGIAGLTLHLFTRREIVRQFHAVGFRLREVQPVSLRPDGRLTSPGWFGRLRAYGYLIAAER